ncbi:hypothetical protein TKK_0007954 [Trichogramma kaykai]
MKLSSLLKSYLGRRTFQTEIGDSITNLYPCEAVVLQGSVLGPTLYLLFTTDFPVVRNVLIATYADDTAVLTSSGCHNEASRSLQNHLDKVSEWCDNWRIKINETNSNHITFTLRKSTCQPVYLKGVSIVQVDQVKYLGIYLDRRLTWRSYIWAKRNAAFIVVHFVGLKLGLSEFAIPSKMQHCKDIIKICRKMC